MHTIDNNIQPRHINHQTVTNFKCTSTWEVITRNKCDVINISKHIYKLETETSSMSRETGMASMTNMRAAPSHTHKHTHTHTHRPNQTRSEQYPDGVIQCQYY